MAQGINMTTEFQTDASLNKTSTNTNDSNEDHIADDTSVDSVSNDTNTDSVNDVSINDVNVASDISDTDLGDGIADVGLVDVVTNDIDTDSIDTDATDENLSETETIDIGSKLKEKRIELGFDERHVATELKLPIDQVRALEANNFSYFRSITFARGFLKSDCRLLDLDYVAMVAAFDSKRADAETTIKPVDKVHKQTHLGDPIVIFISVVIIAVLVFLVFWWPTTPSVATSEDVTNDVVETVVAAETAVEPVVANTTLEAEKTVPLEPVDSEVSDTQEATSSAVAIVPSTKVTEADNKPAEQSKVVTGLSAETVAILKEAGVSPDEVVRATKVVPASDSPVEVPQTVSYLDEVEIDFIEDCWAEIRDASGTILFSGVKSAGSTLALTGDAPYRVVLGYARGVSSLKYKGEQFDFSPFTRKDLARFELK